jgi:5'-methylthioadenosine phosphorylase
MAHNRLNSARAERRLEMGRLAVIGGSGLYQLDGVRVREHREVPTPWGLPSDTLALTEIAGNEVVFLPRHGRGHRFLPSEVPSRANIWALKSLGVEQILALSAVGSLTESCAPGDFVLCDNLVDRTTRRPGSFFGEGIAGHVPFAQPFCGGIRAAASGVLAARSHPHHDSGTYVCMEGPAFSTRAESELHRSWNASLIGMTALPEARLAREAEMCYATLALVTDYDCWKDSGESVSVEMVVATMKSNIEALGRMLPDIIRAMQGRGDCSCRHAARDAIMTDPAFIPYDVRRRLELFYGRYWKRKETGPGG